MSDAEDFLLLSDDEMADLDRARRAIEMAERRAMGLEPYDAPTRANGEAKGGKAAQKRFELIPFDKINFGGAEEWLVKGLLPRQGVGAFFGAKSAFKSFAAQDVGMHVACGWNWGGRRVTQAPVIYIAAEGAGGFKKRKAGFELHHAEHLPETIPFHLVTVAPNLGQGTADREALAEAVRKAGVQPGMIVIDTVAQTHRFGRRKRRRHDSAYRKCHGAIRAIFLPRPARPPCRIDGNRAAARP